MKGVRLLTALLLSLLLTTTAAQANETSAPANPVVTETRINLNTATVEELSQLKGIGAKRAQAIVDYRSANGDFTSVEQITAIKGIGPAFLAKNGDRITVE